MTAYNKNTPPRFRGKSPVKTEPVPTGTTFEGHPGYSRDAKSELFLLGSTQFIGQDKFYEKALESDDRFVNLVRQVAVTDPVWTLQFVTWLRSKANIRSAAIVAGLEAAEALSGLPSIAGYEVPGINTDQGIVRLLSKAGIARADEPGEAMAYWDKKYGGDPGGGVKRGIADKVTELYNEWTLLKYDTDSHNFRFGDVIELVHPKAKAPWQSDLFKYAIDQRHGRGVAPDSLGTIGVNTFLRHMAQQGDFSRLLEPEWLRKAGMTWEDALSLGGSKLDKKALWEALIPSMGYMALLRNLRNFDQAGVSDGVAVAVSALLSDPTRVAKSRQLPFRFLSAYREAPSLRWSWPLEQALQLSLANIPVLGGNTLILVDTSSSMGHLMSDRSRLARWDAAALFGVALAQRCNGAAVVSFSGRTASFPPVAGESLLASMKRWETGGFNLGGGTDTVGALHKHAAGYNRVVIVTDEQASGGYDAYGRRVMYGRERGHDAYLNEVNTEVPANVPLHVINVAGYEKGMMPSGQANRHVYGGLGDFVFQLIPLVEAGAAGKWPWEQQ